MRNTVCALIALSALSGALVAADAAAPTAAPATAPAVSSAMAPYQKTAEAALTAVQGKDIPGATKLFLTLEKQWDDGTAELKKSDKKTWRTIDKQLDVALDALRAPTPDAAKAASEIQSFIAKLALVK